MVTALCSAACCAVLCVCGAQHGEPPCIPEAIASMKCLYSLAAYLYEAGSGGIAARLQDDELIFAGLALCPLVARVGHGQVRRKHHQQCAVRLLTFQVLCCSYRGRNICGSRNSCRQCDQPAATPTTTSTFMTFIVTAKTPVTSSGQVFVIEVVHCCNYLDRCYMYMHAIITWAVTSSRGVLIDNHQVVR